MSPSFRFTFTGLTCLAIAGATANGCAKNTETEPPDTTSSTTGMGGATGGSTNSSSSTSAAGGMGGSGGSTGPCAIDCSTIATPDCQTAVCNDGSHDGPVGQCVIIDEADGTTCDDGLFCTVSDSCTSGTCGGDPNDCSLTPSACEEVVCDETAQDCNLNALTDGTSCSNGDLCVTGETCSFGSCGGGAPVDCFFFPVPNECHVAVCNPMNGMCEATPGNEFQPCTDQNDLCTVNKTCAGGVCIGGTPKDCSNLTMGCDMGVCDTNSGQCTTTAVMNGQTCDDLDGCTTGEVCTNGNCGGGTPITTCSLTGDGCCPSTCTAVNDLDCQCMTDQITTTFAGGNSQNGNMFDVVALKNIEVQGVDVNLAAGTQTIEIYYRVGSYVGFENSSAGWTLAATASVTSTTPNAPTPVPATLAINIPAGQTYAFYVTNTAGTMNYTNGTLVGSIYVQNQDLQILEGIGKSYPFGSTYTPRMWNGILHYEQCGN